MGHGTGDDAAVLRIDGDRALVQTVDFFTPIVDDPYLFGAIAAANSVSDIYAMGAEPILGLAIAGFPSEVLPHEILGEILRGGAEKAAEAGFPVAGGHTIIDDVPKYGLAVTGIAPVDQIVRNSTGRAGDRILLTKPIGNGILVSAWRASGKRSASNLLRGRRRPDLEDAIRWMTTLNREAANAMVEVGVSAATDVSGYGLIGHLLEICNGSAVGARLDFPAVPLLENARAFAESGVAPAGTLRNAEAFRRHLAGSVDDVSWRLLCDAQTSGGLLICVAPERASQLADALSARGVFFAAIGELTDRSGVIEVVEQGRSRSDGRRS